MFICILFDAFGPPCYCTFVIVIALHPQVALCGNYVLNTITKSCKSGYRELVVELENALIIMDRL